MKKGDKKPTLQNSMLVKHKWLKYLILAALAGIVISVTIQIYAPVSPKIPITDTISQNLDQSSSKLNNITYVGGTVEIYENAPVFRATLQADVEQGVIDKLVGSYELKPHETKENLWIGQTHTLTQNDSKNELVLGSVRDSGASFNRVKTSLPEALVAANSFVEDLLPTQNLQAFPNQATYLRGTHHLIEVESNQAALVEIPFSYQLASYPVFFEGRTNWPNRILVDGSGQIVKAVISTQVYSFEEMFKSSMLTPEEALQKANLLNMGSIIGVAQDQLEPVSLTHIDTAELDQAVVEYRLDKNSKLAFPVYRLAGSFTNVDGDVFWGQMLIPAVPVDESGY